MRKEEFIDQLKKALEQNNNEQEKISIIEYYDELISDAIEDGKEEETFISQLGTIEEITKKEQMEQKVKEVEKGPNVKNSFKAIFAILGILSSPIWLLLAIALLVIVFALLIVGISLIFAFGVTTIALVISLIAVFFGIFIKGSIVAFAILPIIGLICIFTGLTLMMAQLTFKTAPAGIVKLYKKIYQKGEKENV